MPQVRQGQIASSDGTSNLNTQIGFIKGVVSNELMLNIDNAKDSDTYLIAAKNKFMRFDVIKNRFVDIGGGTIISNEDAIIQQITKLNITGSISTPYIIDIWITQNVNYSRPPVEILKFKSGSTGLTSTKCSFNNGDASNFNSNDDIVFDGVMRLNNATNFDLTYLGPLGVGEHYSVDINLASYKSIDLLTVN